MRISDWSSDVCSSDLFIGLAVLCGVGQAHRLRLDGDAALFLDIHIVEDLRRHLAIGQSAGELDQPVGERRFPVVDMGDDREVADMGQGRSEEHTSELQSLMRISYAVFCLKNTNKYNRDTRYAM